MFEKSFTVKKKFETKTIQSKVFVASQGTFDISKRPNKLVVKAL